MKQKIFILITFLFISLRFFAQDQNYYDQELTKLLDAKQVFESIDYYTQYQEHISDPIAQDYYDIMMDIHFNRPQNAIQKLPLFLNKYNSVLQDGVKLKFLNLLLSTCEHTQNHVAALQTLDTIETLLKDNPIFEQAKEFNEKMIAKMRNQHQIWKEIPKPEIINVQPDEEDIHIKIQTEDRISLDVKYNNTSIETIFDTGTDDFLFIEKHNLSDLNVKIVEDYHTDLINGVEMPTAYGIVDSVRIESILLKNVPITIVDYHMIKGCLPDSIEKNSAKADSLIATINSMKMVMGIFLIRILNHIQIDIPNKELIVSLKGQENTGKSSNMYMERNKLYAKAIINDICSTVLFDTGGNIDTIALIINMPFYQQNENQLSAISKKETDILNLCGFEGSTDKINFLRPIRLDMQLGDKTFDLCNETIIWQTTETPTILQKDGFIGFGLLKKTNKLTLDFGAMRLECE
jgi:hypothetical protein